MEFRADESDLQMALVSDLITCPLSIVHGLKLINFVLKENIIIHVVGCGVLETTSLKSWDILKSAYKNLVDLKIFFIGPEVEEEDDYSSPLSNIHFKYSSELYHDFMTNDSYEKPDLICTFNCGFHEFQNSDTDTWMNSLPALVSNKNLPLIVTSFTENEAEQDLNRLFSINENLKVIRGTNPFASLRPYRDFESQGVYFNNKYISVILKE